MRLKKYLTEDFEEAKRKYLNWSQPIFEEITQRAKVEIKSSSDIKEKLQKLLNEVDQNAKKLRPR